MNTQTLEDRMMLMKPHELQQFAAMHKNDPYVLPLAMKISDMRKKMTVAQGMQYAGQKQPTVADQAIASINPQQAPQQAAPQQALPENQGIGPLAAPNIQGMADGGIAGYASGTPKGTFDVDAYMNNPNVQKYLAYLNAYEGKPKPNQLVGYKSFDDLSDHPNQRVRFGKSKNQVSTAAGSYQLLKRSWDEQKQKLGLTDFSLENQQRAAIGLLKDNGALKYVARGDFQKANEKAKNIWASLPGSTIGESTGQRARVKPELEAALQKKDGIERLATTQQAPAQPRRVAQREEKFGLDPKLAQFFNNFLPGGEAFAGELPQSQAPVKAPTNLSVPPSNGTRGITQLPTNLVEPTKPLPANLLQPAAAPAKGKGRAAPVEEYSDPMGNISSVPQDAPQAQSGTKRPVASTIASLFDVIPNAFTGTAGEITRAISRPFLSSDEATKQVRGAAETFADPAARILGVRDDPAYRRGPVNAALNQVSEGIDYVGGNVSDVTGIPKDDVTNAINLSPLGLARARSAIKKGGVDYNVPQKAKAGDAGLAMLAERSKQASAEAAAARAKTAPRADTQQMPLAAEPVPQQMSLPGMEPRVPVQGELFPETVPQPKPLKPGEFPIHPDTLAMQERAAQVRGEQSKVAAGLAERRAKEAAAAEAKYRAELEAPKPKSALDKVINAADKVPVQGTLGAAQQGQNRPVEKRPYEAFEENFTAPETNYKLPAPEDLTKKEKKDVVSDVKASPEGKEIKKSGMDFSDKDWLNLGLNLLSAKSEGQYGIQGFLGNLGTAGKETLAQKQEREKIEAAKAFQDIQGRYYEKIASNIGTPQGEERLIDRMAKEQGIPFSDAAEQYYGMRQTDRTNIAGLVTAYNQAKLLDPSAAGMSFQQWAKANGIPLSQTQQTAIDPAAMEIYNRVMKKGG